MNLLPCPACLRHVHAHESTCPFCYVALEPRRIALWPLRTTARLSRAALLALGTGAAAALGACGRDETPAQKTEEPKPLDLPPAPVYGGPPPPFVEDAAPPNVADAAAAADAAPPPTPVAVDAGRPKTGPARRLPAPVYGGPPPSTR